MGDQVRFSVRRVLQIAPKVDDVGSADLYSTACAAGFAKQRRSWRVRCLCPGASAIRGCAEPDEWTQRAPVATGTIKIFQRVGSVVPDAMMDQTASRVPPAIRGGIPGERAEVNDFQLQRIVANDGGLTGGGWGIRVKAEVIFVYVSLIE